MQLQYYKEPGYQNKIPEIGQNAKQLIDFETLPLTGSLVWVGIGAKDLPIVKNIKEWNSKLELTFNGENTEIDTKKGNRPYWNKSSKFSFKGSTTLKATKGNISIKVMHDPGIFSKCKEAASAEISFEEIYNKKGIINAKV